MRILSAVRPGRLSTFPSFKARTTELLLDSFATATTRSPDCRSTASFEALRRTSGRSNFFLEFRSRPREPWVDFAIRIFPSGEKWMEEWAREWLGLGIGELVRSRPKGLGNADSKSSQRKFMKNLDLGSPTCPAAVDRKLTMEFSRMIFWVES